MESAPRATAARLLRHSWPGTFGVLTRPQFTADVDCSISIQGSPRAHPRVRSAEKARTTSGSSDASSR